MSERIFQYDFFSGNIPRWEQWLAGIKGRPVCALEIGSFEGRSACWLLDNILTHPEAELWCVDTWVGMNGSPEVPELFARFLDNIRPFKKVRVIRGESGRKLADLIAALAKFDLIYVDGSHHAADVLMDACCAWWLLNPGGLLIFDDYCWTAPDGSRDRPDTAINAFLECHAGRYELVHQGYQVCVRKKSAA